VASPFSPSSETGKPDLIQSSSWFISFVAGTFTKEGLLFNSNTSEYFHRYTHNMANILQHENQKRHKRHPLLGCGSMEIFAKTDVQATLEELLKTMFSVLSVPRLYNEILWVPVRRRDRILLP
jgi:hypothetical protein